MELKDITLTTYQNYSEDLAFVAGDLIQLYAKTSAPGNPIYLQNFRVLGDGYMKFYNKMT